MKFEYFAKIPFKHRKRPSIYYNILSRGEYVQGEEQCGQHFNIGLFMLLAQPMDHII